MTSDRPTGPPLASPSSPRNLNPAAPVFRQSGQDKIPNSFPSNTVSTDKDFNMAEQGVSQSLGSESGEGQTPSQVDSGGEDVAESVSSLGINDSPEITGDEHAFSEKVIAPIRKQLEYYFSSENLPNDKYINTHMDLNKFVPLELFSNFNRMKPICSEISQMVQAVEMSSLLELNEDKTKVRISQTRKTLTLRGLPPKASENDIRRVLEDNDCPRPMHVEMITLQKAPVSNWYVSFATESECLDAFFKLHNSKVMVDGYSIGCCIKSSGTLAATGSFPSQEDNQQRRATQQTHQSNPITSVSGNITQTPSAVVAGTASQQPSPLMQPFNPMAMHPALMATAGQGLYYNQNHQYLNMPYMTGMITQTWPGTSAVEQGLMLQGGALQPQHIRTQLPRSHMIQNASQPRFIRPQRTHNRPGIMEKGSFLEGGHERSSQQAALSRTGSRGVDGNSNPNAGILSSIARRTHTRDDVTVTIGGHPTPGQQQQHQLVSSVITQPHTVTVGPTASTTIVNSVLDNSAATVPAANPVSAVQPVHNQLMHQQQQQQHQQQQHSHHPTHPPQPLMPNLSGSTSQTSSNQPLITQPQPLRHQSHSHHHSQPPPSIHHQHHQHHHQTQFHAQPHNQHQSLPVSGNQQQHSSQHQLPPQSASHHPHHLHHHHHHHHPHQQPPMHAPSHQHHHHGPLPGDLHHHPPYPSHHNQHMGILPGQHHQPQQPHSHHPMLSSSSHSQQQAQNFVGRADPGNNRRNKKRREDTNNVRNVRGERPSVTRSNFSSQVPPVPDNFTMEAHSFPPLPGVLQNMPSSETSQENRMMHSDIVKGVARVPSLSSNAPPPSATRSTSSSTPSPVPAPPLNTAHVMTMGAMPVIADPCPVVTDEADSMADEDIANLSQEDADVDAGVMEAVATVPRQLHHDLQVTASSSDPVVMPTVQNRNIKTNSCPAPVISMPPNSVHKSSDTHQACGNTPVIQPQRSQNQNQNLPASAAHQEQYQQQQHNILQHYQQQRHYEQQQDNSKERPSYAQILQNKRDAAASEMGMVVTGMNTTPPYPPSSAPISNGPNGSATGQQPPPIHQNSSYSISGRSNMNANNAFREHGNYMPSQGSRPLSHRPPKDAANAMRPEGPQARVPSGRRNSKENRVQGNKLDRRKSESRLK